MKSRPNTQKSRLPESLHQYVEFTRKKIMKCVLTLVEAVEIAWEMKKHKFWTFSIGYLSLYSKSQIILDKKI
jgi:hypothetical protein